MTPAPPHVAPRSAWQPLATYEVTGARGQQRTIAFTVTNPWTDRPCGVRIRADAIGSRWGSTQVYASLAMVLAGTMSPRGARLPDPRCEEHLFLLDPACATAVQVSVRMPDPTAMDADTVQVFDQRERRRWRAGQYSVAIVAECAAGEVGTGTGK